MEKFLEERLSFFIATQQEAIPEDFVVRVEQEKIGQYGGYKGWVLPDGQKHGEFCSFGSFDETVGNYIFGMKHGIHRLFHSNFLDGEKFYEKGKRTGISWKLVVWPEIHLHIKVKNLSKEMPTIAIYEKFIIFQYTFEKNDHLYFGSVSFDTNNPEKWYHDFPFDISEKEVFPDSLERSISDIREYLKKYSFVPKNLQGLEDYFTLCVEKCTGQEKDTILLTLKEKMALLGKS